MSEHWIAVIVLAAKYHPRQMEIFPVSPKVSTAVRAKWTAVLCAALLLGFAFNSYSAALTKNATIDEPNQAMSAWLELHRGDFRIQASPPALWQAWAGLGNLWTDLRLSYDSPLWKDRFWDPKAEIIWTNRILYETPANNGDAFVNRDRAMMLLLGVALGALISLWSYRLCGPVAAVVATSLFCFDPNFLGHAPLIKGDVAFSLVWLGLAFSLWRLGQRVTVGRVIAAGLLCGALVDIKFTGFVAGPLIAMMLLLRAVLPWSWEFFGRPVTGRGQRLIGGLAIGIFAAVCCFGMTWATYGFRYRVSPSQAATLDMPALFAEAQAVETGTELNREPTPAEIAAHKPSRVARFVRWADDRQLLPQAYLAGLLYQVSCVQNWPAFLNNQIYTSGRWSYFLLATLYKSPVASLAAYGLGFCVLAATAAKWLTIRSRLAEGPIAPRENLSAVWTLSCLLVPLLMFGVTLLTAHLNVGIRTALPIFPFLQISVGCSAAIAWRIRRRLTGVLLLVFGTGLLAESLSAWPDYIAFFNVTAGGERGGITLLGDSNLDWGQDIKSLADWQRKNPGPPMYANLFDAMDPGFYGVRFHPLYFVPGRGPVSDLPMVHGVIAVSATHLQGLYVSPAELPFFHRLRETRPIAVLGGTIYLFEYLPPPDRGR